MLKLKSVIKKTSDYKFFKGCNSLLSQNGQVKSLFILSLKIFEDLKSFIPQLSHLNVIIVCMRILLPQLTDVNYIDIKKFFYFLEAYDEKNLFNDCYPYNL